MQLNKFFKIIKDNFSNISKKNNNIINSINSINSEYDELFIRFIVEDKFDNAELMLSNNFVVTPYIFEKIYENLLTKLYSLSAFNLLDHNITKIDYTNYNSDKALALNKTLKFLIRNDLLSLDFLFDTQKISSIFIDDKHIKNLVIQRHKENFEELKKQYRYYLTSPSLKKEYSQKIKNIYNDISDKKKHYLKLEFTTFNHYCFRTVEKSNIFNSSISFLDPIISLDNDEKNSFLSISYFHNHIPLKEFCSINFDDLQNHQNLFEKIPQFQNLTEKQLLSIKEILKSNHLTNIFLISQISRHIIQKTVEKNKISPEDIIQSILNFSEPKELPIKELINTVGFLYPECLKTIDKQKALDILANIESKYTYIKNGGLDNNIFFKKIFTELKETINGTTMKIQKDEILLHTFITNNKNNIIDNDYIKLAKSSNIDQNILEELINIKNISTELLINLKKNSSLQSLEKQDYIKNTDKTIFNTIYDYSQFKDVLESKNDIDSIYNELLKESISTYKKELKNILIYIHQENLKALSDNHKNIKRIMN